MGAGEDGESRTGVPVPVRGAPLPATPDDSLPAPPDRKFRAWLAACMAFMAIGITVTLVQAATASALGTFHGYDWQLSSGGLLGLGVAVYIGVKCRSWADWGKRIWPWLIVAAAGAVTVTVLSSGQFSNESNLPSEPTSSLISRWQTTDTPAKYESVQAPTGAILVDFSEIHICHSGQASVDCLDEVVENYEDVCLFQEVSRESPTYRYQTHDGPVLNACDIQLERIKEAQAEVAAGWILQESGWEKLVADVEITTQIRLAVPETSRVATCFLGSFGECG